MNSVSCLGQTSIYEVAIWSNVMNEIYYMYLWEDVTEIDFFAAIRFILENLSNDEKQWKYIWDDPTANTNITYRAYFCAAHYLCDNDIIEEYEDEGIVTVKLLETQHLAHID